MSKKAGKFDQPQSLMLATIKLAKERDLVTISFETNIPFYWLRKFITECYKNPSVNRVQHLYEHLTSSKLIK